MQKCWWIRVEWARSDKKLKEEKDYDTVLLRKTRQWKKGEEQGSVALLKSGRGAGHPCLVCWSRQKCRTPAPGQGCWTAALGPVSHKGIQARLRSGLKSYIKQALDCRLARGKKTKKGFEVENTGTIKHGNGNKQGTGWSVNRYQWCGQRKLSWREVQKRFDKGVEMQPGEHKARVKAGSKEIPVTCLQNQRDRCLKALQSWTKGCTSVREREEDRESSGQKGVRRDLASVCCFPTVTSILSLFRRLNPPTPLLHCLVGSSCYCCSEEAQNYARRFCCTN